VPFSGFPQVQLSLPFNNNDIDENLQANAHATDASSRLTDPSRSRARFQRGLKQPTALYPLPSWPHRRMLCLPPGSRALYTPPGGQTARTGPVTGSAGCSASGSWVALAAPGVEVREIR
jgi:hypothetical protein